MKVAKAVAAAVGTTVTVLIAALADDVVDISELTQTLAAAATGAATVYGVWKVRNVA